jgi:hypothetical protein
MTPVPTTGRMPRVPLMTPVPTTPGPLAPTLRRRAKPPWG